MKEEIKVGSLAELIEEVVTGWELGTIAEPTMQKEEKEEPFFKTQQEIWKYLSEQEGRRVISSESNNIIGFQNGELVSYASDRTDESFQVPSSWRPAKEWWELNGNKPTLCYFGDAFTEDGTLPYTDIIIREDNTFTRPSGTVNWRYAIPVPKEEALKFIFGEQDGKD